MRKAFKILSLLLALAMVFSCVGIQAFAAAADEVKQYGADPDGGYLAIGDSHFRGYGSTGYYKGQTDTITSFWLYFDPTFIPLRNVEGSVPYTIAQAVGCDCGSGDLRVQDSNYWPVCFSAYSLSAVMDLYGIEDNYDDSALIKQTGYYGWEMYYYGCEDSFDGPSGETYTEQYSGVTGNIDKLTEKASLITIEIGMEDVFGRPYMLAQSDMYEAYANGETPSVTDFYAKMPERMLEGYKYWVEAYPMLIEHVMELNQGKADIVLVSAFNMLAGVTLTDDTLLPVMDTLSLVVMGMNAHMKQWAKEYGLIYADISNTETMAAELDWSLIDDVMSSEEAANFLLATHPTQDGHDYIARQILNALKENVPSTDIVVDLGRIKSVDYVLVNGIPVTDYTFDPSSHTITIHNSSKLCVSLTIAVVGADRKVAVQTYQLSYNRDTGYTAYRTYSTNDVAGVATKPVNAISKLFSSLSGLFKK